MLTGALGRWLRIPKKEVITIKGNSFITINGPFGSRIRRGRGDILIKNVFGSQGEWRDFKIILLFYPST